jgi:hypothetical protein
MGFRIKVFVKYAKPEGQNRYLEFKFLNHLFELLPKGGNPIQSKKTKIQITCPSARLNNSNHHRDYLLTKGPKEFVMQDLN